MLSAAEMAVTDVHAVEDLGAPYLHPVVKMMAPWVGLSVDPKTVHEFDP